MSQQEEVLLEMRDIHKTYAGVQALKGVGLTLHRGEILGLIGENGAGKSTLMKILIGIERPDSGSMVFLDKPYAPPHARAALSKGISMIHQELSLVPELTVSENIWLGREDSFQKAGFIMEKRRNEATEELFSKMEIELNPKAICKTLSVANQQLTEVARAISYDSKIIIMDEPTSALTEVEVGKLFGIMRRLAEAGKGVIFISHKLSELIAVSDRVTVLRDGSYIGTYQTDEVNENFLVQKMVGREVKDLYPKVEAEIGGEALRVSHATRYGAFSDVSFNVKYGEILGFCGLLGAGRTEIMESVFGLNRMDAGEVFLRGKKVTIRSASDALQNGIAMVTEDRLNSGLIHCLGVGLNMSLSYLGKLLRFMFINTRAEQKKCAEYVGKLEIKTSGLKALAGVLSGGNQQKVILGRCMMTEPEILILDEPTRGIDVGAKAEIYKIIGSFAQAGKAVIVISSELPELMGICDRILVVRHGKVAGECSRDSFDENTLMGYAFGTI